MPEEKALSPKQERFAEEYLVDLNATQAAIRAGYSKKTAGVQAYDLLKKPQIAAAIQKGRARISEATQVTQEQVIQELARVGFSDLRKTMTDAGGLLEPCDWDDDTARAVASYEVALVHRGEKDDDGKKIPERIVKVKTWDKLAALDKLARHLGVYNDEPAQGVVINLHSDAKKV